MAPDEETKASTEPLRHRRSGSNAKENALPLCYKLLLNAAMTGNDVCVSFQQLFQVPLMQILGVPITFVSVYPIVTGPLVMVLMYLLGRLSDRGPRQDKKKMVSVIFNSVVLAVGMVILIVANSMLSMNEINSNVNAGSISKNSNSNTLENFTTVALQNQRLLPTPVTASQENLDAKNKIVKSSKTLDDRHFMDTLFVTKLPDKVPNVRQEDGPDLLSLPTTAILGLIGFCLMDVGYDLNIAAVRSCVLACSPKQDHASLLVLALAMAALGGCITNAFGLVDLSATFDFAVGERSLVSQTTVQLGICSIVLIVSVTSTIATALYNTRYLYNDHSPLHNDETTGEKRNYGTFDNDSEEKIIDADDNYGTQGSTTINTNNIKGCQSNTATIIADKALAEADKSTLTNPGDKTESDENGFTEAESRSSGDPVPSSENGSHADKGKCCRLNKHKLNFSIVCLTLYLGPSAFFSYNMFVSNFLGKVVMGGDSTAPEGSAELKAYEDGVNLAASGLLLFYCSYIIVSSVHSKLLKFWGLKVDLCLSHVLMATAILCLTLSKEVAFFYVANVLYGFQRSAILTVPFILADKYTQEQNVSEDGKPAVGKVMAVVSCMIPLNFCTIYLLSGPLITLTHYDGAPLFVACVATYLAALVAFFYGRF